MKKLGILAIQVNFWAIFNEKLLFSGNIGVKLELMATEDQPEEPHIMQRGKNLLMIGDMVINCHLTLINSKYYLK